MKSNPHLVLLNQQSLWSPPQASLLRSLQRAISEVKDRHGLDPAIREIEILLVSPEESARLHKEFFGDPSPTDVMTFPVRPCASIVCCPAVAGDQRREEGLSLYEELLTYGIHGFLHLAGLDDHSDQDFARMEREQTEIRKRVLGQNA